jgi:uncharacterized RDD family membrane protein YckC
MNSGDVNLRGQYAGFVSRLLAYAIDLALVTISLIAIGWLANTSKQLLGLPDLLPPEIAIFLNAVVAFVIVVGYYTILWAVTGQTVGKLIMGLRVIPSSGKSHLSFAQSLARFFGYVVSVLPLFAGFLWILVDNERQGWHDKIAKTRVVYHWDARANIKGLQALQAQMRARQSGQQ